MKIKEIAAIIALLVGMAFACSMMFGRLMEAGNEAMQASERESVSWCEDYGKKLEVETKSVGSSCYQKVGGEWKSVERSLF